MVLSRGDYEAMNWKKFLMEEITVGDWVRIVRITQDDDDEDLIRYIGAEFEVVNIRKNNDNPNKSIIDGPGPYFSPYAEEVEKIQKG